MAVCNHDERPVSALPGPGLRDMGIIFQWYPFTTSGAPQKNISGHSAGQQPKFEILMCSMGLLP